jgi:hypothetical protein
MICLEEVRPVFSSDVDVIENNEYGKMEISHVGWFWSDKPFSVVKNLSKIESEKTCNAFFRDLLLKKPWIISKIVPKSLINSIKICLFGTKYQKDGRKFIEYLYYKNGVWLIGVHYLDQPLLPDYVIPFFKF